jgi:hypothetical protein
MAATRREQLRSALEGIPRRTAACPQAPLAAFEEALQHWASQRCVYHERCWGGVTSLHLDYAAWCDQEVGEVPCSLLHFTEWLTTQGFQVDGFRLVHGLVLKSDLCAPAAGKTGGNGLDEAG